VPQPILTSPRQEKSHLLSQHFDSLRIFSR
jgi:hypothetical protein